MDLGLRGSVAVVMASSRGLGRAIAQELAAEGATVVLAARHAESLARTAAEIASATGGRTIAVPCDVTQPDAIARLAARVEADCGRCDVLVNNGGGPQPGTFDALDEGAFLRAADLLLLNCVRTTKALLPLMRRGGRGGRIITVTSTSVREPLANLMLSNSLRAAVAGWSKTLARELAPEGILVTCLAPGTIDTERIAELVAANAQRSGRSPEQVRADLIARIPLGRLGRPEEFAAAAAFLASARASFITGTTLTVDGCQSVSVG